MNLLGLAGEIIFISTSGVLSPGPLFFANMLYGSRKGPRAAVKIAFGHTIVEFPLVMIVAVGLLTYTHGFLSTESLTLISLLGGIAMLVFSLTQIISVTKRSGDYKSSRFPWITDKKGPILAGIIFSALNPFFLIWWMTVGLKLISDSIHSLGFASGVAFLFSFHIWMDYGWLILTSYLMYNGILLLKNKFYSALQISISTALGAYGVYLIVTIFLHSRI
jgi:threonine/homoserine/homoserine lactone efflux protein